MEFCDGSLSWFGKEGGLEKTVAALSEERLDGCTVLSLPGRVGGDVLSMAETADGVWPGRHGRRAAAYAVTRAGGGIATGILGKAPYSGREWCWLGRVRTEKRACSRGTSSEWMIGQEKIMRIKAEGLGCPSPRCDATP
jgi:hypothetical protein